MTARIRRVPRPVRPARAKRVQVPSLAVMRARGPRPPDAVIARLARVLELELAPWVAARRDADDPEQAPRLGARWKAALALALLAITRAARRGVVAALAGTGAPVALARAAPVPAPNEDPTEDIERSARVSLKRGVAAAAGALIASAIGVMARWVLGEHARAVKIIARAAGSARYRWITRRDEKVRRLHVLLEGTEQRWDDPPLVGLPDFHGCPGEAGGCRCTAWPLV